MNIPSLHGLPCRPDGSARQTMKRGLEIGGSVTQGGSRCAPLPWAIFSLPLRGGRQSLLRSSMTMFSSNLAEDAGANRAKPLGWALGFLVCSCQFSGRSAHVSPLHTPCTFFASSLLREHSPRSSGAPRSRSRAQALARVATSWFRSVALPAFGQRIAMVIYRQTSSR